MVSKSKNNDKSESKFLLSDEDMLTRIIGNSTEGVADNMKGRTMSTDELQDMIVQPNWSKLEGSFSNLDVIGMGGMGTVFSAKDSLFYRNVALKIMRNDLRNQNKNVNSFIREARITAQIDHPNIIPVYNLGIFQEVGPYFSMKKVEGITLAEVLKKLEQKDKEFEKEYTLRRRLEIFINICNGVAFAHSKGIVHCDLKPGNIMIGNYGEVFIMDWGMAIYRSEKDLSSQNKKIDLREKTELDIGEVQETINGTPAFMAPEQIFGKKDAIDEQTDVYALGVILYTLLTCTQSPFPQKLSSEEIFDKALAGDFLSPRKRAPKLQISNELEIVCLKSMSPYKHERYENVISLRQDIRNILDMHPVEVYSSPFSNFIKYCRRHPMIPTALLGAIITLTVFYSYFSLNNLLDAKALHEVLVLNTENSSAMFNMIRSDLRRNNAVRIEQGYDIIFDENKDFETRNIKMKLDISCLQILDTMAKLNELTFNSKYLPQIYKALELCVNYSLLTHNSDNILKIQQMDSGLVYQAYLQMIRKDSDLRRKMQLLSINSGNLILKTADKKLSIFISKQINQDSVLLADKNQDEKTDELILKNGSFNILLKQGEYSLLLADEKENNVSIPIVINPGENTEVDFTFPKHIPKDCIYVHEGAYYSNISNHYSFGKKVYLDGFFLLDRELTIGEYHEFWRNLKNDELKTKYNPNLLLNRDGNVVISKLFQKDGSILFPYKKEMPLVGVSVEGAQAFCKYMSDKLQMTCRLPYFMELEKASRGTGRRLYVWGNVFDAKNALLSTNPELQKYPFGAPPKTFERDYSLYGAYDLSGNVRELVQLKNSVDKFAVYGGSYRNTANYAKCGTLSRLAENRIDVGMRYVIELPKNRDSTTNK